MRMNDINQLDKLKGEIADVEWEFLRPHFVRGGLLLVSPLLDLSLVAYCFATDKKHAVETWLKQKDIAPVTDDEAKLWDQNPMKKFSFVIVQPYVLSQQKW